MNVVALKSASVASGMPKLRIEESAARRQAQIDRGDEVIVGVNKYRKDREDPIDILDVDNVAVRESQIARLEKTRASRDQAACDAALRLSHMGVQAEGYVRDLVAAMDDMGAGHASLQALAAIEPDFLKFDVSLVRDIDKSSIKKSLLDSLRTLAEYIHANTSNQQPPAEPVV